MYWNDVLHVYNKLGKLLNHD